MSDLQRQIEAELGFGVVPNIFAYAQSAPDVQAGLWLAFRHIVMRGQLPRTLKEIMGVIVSQEHGSPYAAQVHLHALMLQGVERAIVDALADGRLPTELPPKSARLLSFARDAARRPQDPTTREQLVDAGFSPAEIAEAVAVVGLFRMLNLWTDTMAIPIDAL
jgi:alkylhydroperoxidase family enzyme